MDITLTFDPSDEADLDRVEAVLIAVRQVRGHVDAGPVGASTERSLEAVVGQIANPEKYGETRLGYLRLVAKAGADGIAVSELLKEHFGGSHNAFGGTHSSIERSWRTLGGAQWANQLISDTPQSRQVMYPAAVPLVLALLSDYGVDQLSPLRA